MEGMGLTIASGNERSKNNEIAGKTMSLVNGSERVYAAAVNEPKETSSGMVPQNIIPTAFVTPILRNSLSSCSLRTCSTLAIKNRSQA